MQSTHDNFVIEIYLLQRIVYFCIKIIQKSHFTQFVDSKYFYGADFFTLRPIVKFTATSCS